MANYSSTLYKNGQGIPAVHVVMYNSNNVKVAATTTGGGTLEVGSESAGTYSFTGIQPGQYELRFFGEGFDSRDNLTIDIAGDSTDVSKEVLLQSLIERHSSLTWASRSVLDIMTDTTSLVRNDALTTLKVSDGTLKLPSTTQGGVTEYYYTEEFETSISGHIISGMDTALVFADYLKGNGDIIIQTQFESASWYTWLDTASGIDRLGTETTDANFVDGTKLKVRIGITPGSDNTGGQINHLAVYTGPDLFGAIEE